MPFEVGLAPVVFELLQVPAAPPAMDLSREEPTARRRMDAFDNEIVTPRGARAWSTKMARLIMDARGEADAAHIGKVRERIRADDSELKIHIWEMIAEAFEKLRSGRNRSQKFLTPLPYRPPTTGALHGR